MLHLHCIPLTIISQHHFWWGTLDMPWHTAKRPVCCAQSKGTWHKPGTRRSCIFSYAQSRAHNKPQLCHLPEGGHMTKVSMCHARGTAAVWWRQTLPLCHMSHAWHTENCKTLLCDTVLQMARGHVTATWPPLQCASLQHTTKYFLFFFSPPIGFCGSHIVHGTWYWHLINF